VYFLLHMQHFREQKRPGHQAYRYNANDCRQSVVCTSGAKSRHDHADAQTAAPDHARLCRVRASSTCAPASSSSRANCVRDGLHEGRCELGHFVCLQPGGRWANECRGDAFKFGAGLHLRTCPGAVGLALRSLFGRDRQAEHGGRLRDGTRSKRGRPDGGFRDARCWRSSTRTNSTRRTQPTGHRSW
jgi:hypothetical protein